MNSLLRISDAASMAIHTVSFLASNTGRYHPAREIAGRLSVSESHLAKVLQRLARGEIVESVRGPKGGFKLVASWKVTSLLDVFEVIDGPFRPSECLMSRKTCSGEECIFGDLLTRLSGETRSCLEAKRLGELTRIYGLGEKR